MSNEKQHDFPYQEDSKGRIQIGLSSVQIEIPWETHEFITQFFRVEAGQGLLEYVDPQSRQKVVVELKDGISVVIPQGVPHRIANTQGYNRPLKLYAIYAKDSSVVEWLH